MKGAAPSGYTIVETMVFLGVAMTLFITAIAMIGGRQREVQFAQGVNETDARIRDVLNDVANGFYPNIGGFNCNADPVTADSQPVLSAGSNTQGTNQACVFIGKVIQFYQDSDQMHVFTIIGRRQTPNGSGGSRLATSLYEAQPVASTGVADLTERRVLQWGVNIYKMVYTLGSGGPQDTDAVGFFSSLGQYGATGDPVSGAQQVSLATINTTNLTNDEATLLSKIDCSTDTNCGNGVATPPLLNLNNNLRLTICLQNDGGSKKAAIVIGTSGRQLSTDVQINPVGGVC